jgi:hypothetical protein
MVVHDFDILMVIDAGGDEREEIIRCYSCNGYNGGFYILSYKSLFL